MEEILKSFDKFLTQKGLKFEGIVIGGAALILIHVINRATRDVDILSPHIPDEIKKASSEFAIRESGFSLNPDEWFNNGPYSLKRDLPEGWELRTEKILKGKSLTLYTLGRMDILRSKLYAACDREIDFDDCLALAPSNKELDICYEWVLKGDANPLWPKRVTEVFGRLKKELGNE